MSSSERRSAAFSGFIEPPYWIRTASATSSPYVSATMARIPACASWAIAGVAVRPVPIAQTGSYAIVVSATRSAPMPRSAPST